MKTERKKPTSISNNKVESSEPFMNKSRMESPEEQDVNRR